MNKLHICCVENDLVKENQFYMYSVANGYNFFLLWSIFCRICGPQTKRLSCIRTVSLMFNGNLVFKKKLTISNNQHFPKWIHAYAYKLVEKTNISLYVNHFNWKRITSKYKTQEVKQYPTFHKSLPSPTKYNRYHSCWK